MLETVFGMQNWPWRKRPTVQVQTIAKYCTLAQVCPIISKSRCPERDSVYHHTHHVRHDFTTIEYTSHLT